MFATKHGLSKHIYFSDKSGAGDLALGTVKCTICGLVKSNYAKLLHHVQNENRRTSTTVSNLKLHFTWFSLTDHEDREAEY